MPPALQPLKSLDEQEQAIFFHSRERRRSLAGIPEMNRTHQLYGETVMEIADIATGDIFPVRTNLVSFKTAITITENAGQHRGLVFEFGDDAIGVALWVGDQTIGFHAGEDGVVNGATALFDNAAELPVGLELELIAAVRPGDGRVRVWANGNELARSTASSDTFGVAGAWTAASNGSFAAAAQGTVVPDVPAISQGAPAGFTVIEPLSVYEGQVPRHFT
ncbi:hypothetical protein KAR91_64125 [Candidatus Pacearchaeota archaeon]|nr:hypothetical protein [Candidatus Pacearchaeota archaeon]